MHRAPLPLFALVFALGVAPASAEDPKPGEPSPLRVFHVGALVQGRTDYIPSQVGLATWPGQVEALPLFGAQGEEPILPVGNVDELVELVRSSVDPSSWDALSGADLKNWNGNSLLARHEPETLARLGALLGRLEDRWLRPLSVDVVAVRLPADAPAAPAQETLAAWVAGADAGPGIALACLPGQRVTGFAGREQAFLCDYDVEVATKSNISDPIISVLNTGLSVSVRAIPAEDGSRVRVALDAQLALSRATEPVPGGAGRKLESPQLDRVGARVTADLPPGTWVLLDGGGARSSGRSWSFLARARLGERVARAPTTGQPLPVLESAGMGRLAERAFNVALLAERVASTLPPALDLLPSNFTPPEPPELPEPRCAADPEALVELLRSAIAPEAWGSRGGTLEARKDTLYVRAPATAIEAVEHMLAALERAFLWAIEADVEVLEVPAAMALSGELVLSPKDGETLAAALASGAATRVDRVRVTSYGGARNHVFVGDERTVLADYEVEIAEDSSITNPIMATLRTGLTLDVAPGLVSTLDAAVFTVRFTRSELVQLRSVASTAGEIQCPEVRMTRLRNDLEVPFGRTGVLGATLESGRRTLVLLTPRLLSRR